MTFCFFKRDFKIAFFTETIKPAATFKATEIENSSNFPLKISIIFFELYSAFLPLIFSRLFKSIPNSFGSIVKLLIFLSLSSTTNFFKKEKFHQRHHHYVLYTHEQLHFLKALPQMVSSIFCHKHQLLVFLLELDYLMVQ